MSLSSPSQLVVQPARSRLLGILYAEDFDDVTDDAESALQSVPPPPLTQPDIDAACVAAVATARQEWQGAAEHLRAQSLAQIGAALADARQAAEQIAATAAEAAAQTMLAMLCGAMPHFCDEHGPAEVRAILRHLLPTLRSEPRILLRVHPDVAPEWQREFANLQPEFSGMLTVLPNAAEPGDLKIEWENGSLTRDTRQILQAMQDALSELGLQPTPEAMPKRRLAHAE